VTPDLPVELRALPKPGFGRNIVLVARKGELGDFPRKIVTLCRGVLRKDYLPRLQATMPNLADHLVVVDDQFNAST
jgi:hypothetical protein